MNPKRIFYGVGVGPGDPELITLKACRLIQAADLVVYLTNEQGQSQARSIAEQVLEQSKSGQQELGLAMPMQMDRSLANKAYDQAALKIAKVLTGHDSNDSSSNNSTLNTTISNNNISVVFLCEGDPLFFGSFAYLLLRLQDDFHCEVVPGICSVNAASAALNLPLTLLSEKMTVVSGRHCDDEILQALNDYDSVVILKAGQARPRLLKLLAQSGRSQEAHYLEYISRDDQHRCSDVSTLAAVPGPYFSLFVVTRKRERIV